MLTDRDLKEINNHIEGIKKARELNIKAKATVVLENGTEAIIYYLGRANNTIRIDIKGE